MSNLRGLNAGFSYPTAKNMTLIGGCVRARRMVHASPDMLVVLPVVLQQLWYDHVRLVVLEQQGKGTVW